MIENINIVTRWSQWRFTPVLGVVLISNFNQALESYETGFFVIVPVIRKSVVQIQNVEAPLPIPSMMVHVESVFVVSVGLSG